MPKFALFLVLTGFVVLSGCSGAGEAEINSTELYTYTPDRTSEIDMNTYNTYLYDRYDNTQSRQISDDVYNCSDFESEELAQEAFVESGGPENDPNDLDRDGDGLACEYDPRQEIRSSTYKVNSNQLEGANCHYVNGYYRKDGTHVRGHERCR